MAYQDWANLSRCGLSSTITPAGRIGNGLPTQSHSDSADELRFIGQIQGNNLSQTQAGAVEQQFTPAGRLNSTKPTGVGEAYIEHSIRAPDGVNLNEQVLSTRVSSVITSISGGTIHTYYKMQGYYVAGAAYETWVSIDSPSLTPPSGHSLINIAVVGKWSQ